MFAPGTNLFSIVKQIQNANPLLEAVLQSIIHKWFTAFQWLICPPYLERCSSFLFGGLTLGPTSASCRHTLVYVEQFKNYF